jgi:hypothetical protein
MEYDSICLQVVEILRIVKKIVTVRGNSYVGLEKSRDGIQRLEGNKILGAV